MNKILTYNRITCIIFIVLIIFSFSCFTSADSTDLSLFEDYDRDGISNDEESSYKTDPRKADTDGDGYSDGVEIESGYNPLVPAPGDRIMKPKQPVQISSADTQSSNVTKNIAEDVVSYLKDVKESGSTDISSEEFSQAVAKAVDEKVEFVDVEPIKFEEITIKKQDYDNLSDKEREGKMKEDATEYFTAISYIFISNFPDGFFEMPVEQFQSEFMNNMSNFSMDLSGISYFEELAKNAVAAEEQMDEIIVPEEMIEVHSDGLYLLRYAASIYKSGNYENVSTDVTPMIASLAQLQGLLDQSEAFHTKVAEKIEKYELGGLLVDF